MDNLGPIASAVVHDLAALPEDLARSPLAASALHLARLQDATVSARDVASIAREFRATWSALTAHHVATEEGDEVDELLDRRLRREGRTGPEGAVGP